jgi:putative chitobiose transport system permease protein
VPALAETGEEMTLRASTVMHYLALCAIALVCVFPFWWTVVTALSTEGNIFAFPPTFWPKSPSLVNFETAFRVIPFFAFFKNSVLIAAFTVFWKLVLCSMAAYPLARLRFRGRQLVFGLILATMVLPSEVNFLVNFITVTKLSLVDTYAGVILPNVVTAVAILLLKQAFEEVPQDLIDAARVDGASEWTIFTRIMLPLVEAWNEYIWPSIVMSKPDEFPLSVGVLYLRGTFGSSTRVIAAGTVLTILPTLAAFLFTQRYFMRGMDGAVK